MAADRIEDKFVDFSFQSFEKMMLTGSIVCTPSGSQFHPFFKKFSNQEKYTTYNIIRLQRRRSMGDFRHSSKRHHSAFFDEEAVDDLAVAAQYAMIPTLGSARAFSQTDEDEIDLEEAPSTEGPINSIRSQVNYGTTSAKISLLGPEYDSTDDSEEESDVEDIVERLAHMEGGEGGDDSDEEDDERPEGVRPRKPLTMHEIDPYQADLHQLPDLLQWSTLMTTQLQPGSGPPEWRMAGHVQHHVIEERTIVVLSLQGDVLLKEGTPLVLKQQPTNSLPSSSSDGSVIPLGNILGIFGPVSQPLYSVRLALPAKEEQVSADEVTDSRESKDSEHTSSVDCPEAASSVNDDKAEPSVRGLDPWSKTGQFTKVLQSKKRCPVFFWHDPAAIMDRESVYRNSSRGCDASNFYDEEILDVQDYSDDEQERVAKGHKKKSESRSHGPTMHSKGHERPHRPSAPKNAFYQSRAAASTGLPPYGFHSQNQPTNIPFHLPGFPVGGAPYAGGAGYTAMQHISPQGIPEQQQPYYFYNGTYHTIPPPPPLPLNAVQQSSSQHNSTDAVYYDFS